MATAPGMMMRNSLLGIGRELIAVAVIVTGGFDGGGEAIESLCRMRHRPGQERNGENQGADEGRPASHQRRP